MTSAADAVWRELTAPAKSAMRWASASATVLRGEGAVADWRDLLIGIMLADPLDNPAKTLFEHLKIAPVAVLGGALPDAWLLRGQAKKLAGRQAMPRLDGRLAHELQGAARARRGVSLGLKHLFLLVLGYPQVEEGLSRFGVSWRGVVDLYQEFLAGRRPLEEVLRNGMPYGGGGVRLPRYVGDQPPSKLEVPSDLVGVGPEVDAFAHLMASRKLVPPLAVGLFGDWGSGKSYFLRRLQHRVDELAGSGSAVFHRSIVQIEFNAWQYVGGDLWAGLVEHLFRNLRLSGDESDDLIGQRQRYWVDRLREVEGDQASALAEWEQLEQARSDAESLVAERERERERTLAELDRARRERPLLGWRPSAELREQVAKSLGLTEFVANGEALHAELDRAREDLRGVNAVLEPVRSGGWRYGLAVLGLAFIAPALTLLAEWVDTSALTTATGAVAGLATGATGYLALVGRYARSATDKIAKARAELVAEEQRERDRLDQEVAAAETALAEAEAALDTAREQERGYADRITEISGELEATTPRRVLTDFINERLGSEDYRRHLGVPALVRRDLERLSRLVTAHHAQSHGAQPAGDYAIDRVVLYIDDLDRCPAPLVAKVLEAVNLLLAFPLFVVVVAVDLRWLESSLREHYSQLQARERGAADYLEKIFQVGFSLPQLNVEVRRTMLRELITPNVRAPAVEDDGVAPDGDLGESDMTSLYDVISSWSAAERWNRPERQVADLVVSAEEAAMVEEVADLIGPTPRAVKRFVNVYLLIRAIGIARGLPVPDGGDLVVLLAVVKRFPAVAGFAGTATTVSAVGEHMPEVRQWVETHLELGAVPLGPVEWLRLADRFRFTRG
ncbi:P-loop NTPase fold protein [Actinosynnema sp. NPDC020468]|uniref:P-loop NTPase fold protein n=1 Tax=Actinosynnema sp. NPDC020468 TaxID=3154488 RepID=UPI0033FC1196